jgi:hypothetical protein
MLSPSNGAGPLRADLVAQQAGELVVQATGSNPDCGFSTVVRTTITVRQ